ncbi:MAG: acyl carrier protein [Ilumatobacter sp.]|uniref:acyl carrier protein n=1 Tax=Ilumatobacter sp. TaxID=1967498 RepID=UPI0032982D11
MTDETTDLILTLVSEALDVDPAELDTDAELADVEGWDSLRQLNVMIAIEESTGVAMEPDDLREMTTLGRIAQLVVARQGR